MPQSIRSLSMTVEIFGEIKLEGGGVGGGSMIGGRSEDRHFYCVISDSAGESFRFLWRIC